MPCIASLSGVAATPAVKARVKDALDRLERAIQDNQVRVVIGLNGAIAFKGSWRNDGVSDICAYRALTIAGSTTLRAAVARAEVLEGRQVNPQAIGAGVHSHDGGKSWHAGH